MDAMGMSRRRWAVGGWEERVSRSCRGTHRCSCPLSAFAWSCPLDHTWERKTWYLCTCSQLEV